MPQTLEQLVERGRIERVQPDETAGRSELDQARANIASAGSELHKTNPVLAYTALYDAARLAISAHMRVSGYRVTGGPGAHTRFGEYASAALADQAVGEHLARFDRMRQTRNRIEYGAWRVGAAEVRAALEHARAIVTTVELDLEAPEP
jgi:hypothetical protein